MTNMSSSSRKRGLGHFLTPVCPDIGKKTGLKPTYGGISHEGEVSRDLQQYIMKMELLPAAGLNFENVDFRKPDFFESKLIKNQFETHKNASNRLFSITFSLRFLTLKGAPNADFFFEL